MNSLNHENEHKMKPKCLNCTSIVQNWTAEKPNPVDYHTNDNKTVAVSRLACTENLYSGLKLHRNFENGMNTNLTII